MRRTGDLEAAVMAVLWASPTPQPVRQVLEVLRPERDLAYTTVMTVMERLFRKGMLVREPDGKAYRYAPAMTRADYTAQMMAQALHRSDDHAAALVHFAAQLSRQERKALSAALQVKPRGKTR